MREHVAGWDDDDLTPAAFKLIQDTIAQGEVAEVLKAHSSKLSPVLRELIKGVVREETQSLKGLNEEQKHLFGEALEARALEDMERGEEVLSKEWVNREGLFFSPVSERSLKYLFNLSMHQVQNDPHLLRGWGRDELDRKVSLHLRARFSNMMHQRILSVYEALHLADDFSKVAVKLGDVVHLLEEKDETKSFSRSRTKCGREDPNFGMVLTGAWRVAKRRGKACEECAKFPPESWQDRAGHYAQSEESADLFREAVREELLRAKVGAQRGYPPSGEELIRDESVISALLADLRQANPQSLYEGFTVGDINVFSEMPEEKARQIVQEMLQKPQDLGVANTQISNMLGYQITRVWQKRKHPISKR